jgi:hypothetical protein
VSHIFAAVILPNDQKKIKENLIQQLHTFEHIIDWWRIGGRYDGAIRGERRFSEDGYNHDTQHELLSNNIATTEEVLFKKIIPPSIIVNHQWYCKLREVGWKIFPHDQIIKGNWIQQVRKLLLKHPQHLVIGIDIRL